MSLINDIETFLKANPELAPSELGARAINDRHLVRDLRGVEGRKPRRVWPETEAKIRHFMLTYRPVVA